MKNNQKRSFYALVLVSCLWMAPLDSQAQVTDTTALLKSWKIDFSKTFNNFSPDAQTAFHDLPVAQQDLVENNANNRQVIFQSNGNMQTQHLEALIPNGSQWIWLAGHTQLKITKPDASVLVCQVDLLDATALTLSLGGYTLYFKNL